MGIELLFGELRKLILPQAAGTSARDAVTRQLTPSSGPFPSERVHLWSGWCATRR